MKTTLLAILIGLVLLPTCLFAEDKFCFEKAGQTYNISPILLKSISDVESTREEQAIGYNANSYDFCHMQINSKWADKIGIENWLTLGDPCQCTMWGAWILSTCIERYGYTWQAIGCYHSPTEERRVNYAWAVYKQMAKIKE